MFKIPVISWFDSSTLKHLRFKFSFFLLPVFLFALSQAGEVNWRNAFTGFFILHFMIFPSSNGYNSYQDRDETSIGGLKNPPKVSKNLFRVTLFLDVLAIFFGLFISIFFSLLLILFITMSRLYSYRKIRLKKYPVTGFLTVFIFQGAFVYLMSMASITEFSLTNFFTADNFICMAISSLFIGSMYPLTQIYQHEADKNDGVISISYKLGYTGTFRFSAILFAVATFLLFLYFNGRREYISLAIFVFIIIPVVTYLAKWYKRVRRDTRQANYENTMKINLLSSVCMNLFFIILVINNHLLFFQ